MNAYIIKPDTIFKLSDDKDILNIEVLNGLITSHKTLITNRYKKSFMMPILEIIQSCIKPIKKPINPITVLWSTLQNTLLIHSTVFLLGFQSKYHLRRKEIDDYINLLDKYNDQDDNNAELSKICSVFGKGYELYFNDDYGNLGITYLDPRERVHGL